MWGRELPYDGAVVSCMPLLALLFGMILDMEYQHDRKLSALCIGCAIVLNLSIKFNNLVFCGVLGIAFFVFYTVCYKKKLSEYRFLKPVQVFALLACIVVFSIVVVGFAPYITNIQRYGSPAVLATPMDFLAGKNFKAILYRMCALEEWGYCSVEFLFSGLLFCLFLRFFMAVNLRMPALPVCMYLRR